MHEGDAAAGTSQLVPILLNLLAAFFGAGGQYLYKLGAARMDSVPLLRNWALFAGVVLFCVVMGCFVWAFKLGGRLSVVYPVYATTFFWGMLLAVLVDGEPYSGLQIAGVAVIVLGVAMLAVGYPR